jgi:hypothetical protein
MSDPHGLSAGDQAQLTAILAACPELAALQAHVAAFADLMTNRRGRALETWIAAAAASLYRAIDQHGQVIDVLSTSG